MLPVVMSEPVPCAPAAPGCPGCPAVPNVACDAVIVSRMGALLGVVFVKRTSTEMP